MKIDRKFVYDKFNGRCAYCGCNLNGKFQVDHVMSRENFERYVKNNHKVPSFLSHLTINDLNHIDNLMPACASCNNYKSTFDLEDFRYELGQLLIRLEKTVTIYRIAKRYGRIAENRDQIQFYFEQWKEAQK